MGDFFNSKQQEMLQQQQNQLYQQIQLQLQLQQQQQAQLQQLLQQQQMLQRQVAMVATAATATMPSNLQGKTASITVSDDEEPMGLNTNSSKSKSNSKGNRSKSVAYQQEEISDPETAIVQQHITGNEAKMLVIQENGVTRLITFAVIEEDCTVQDLLQQANILSSREPRVSLATDPALEFNYIVDVDYEEDQLPERTTDTLIANSVKQLKTPIKNISNPPPVTTTAARRRLKHITGMIALCPYCGMGDADLSTCSRCKRKLPENVKTIPVFSNVAPKNRKQKDAEVVSNIEEPLIIYDKEPIINNNSISPLKSTTKNQAVMPNCTPAIEYYSLILLNCKTVRIGSYKCVPSNGINFISDGLQFKVPSLKYGKKIMIHIRPEDIVKILASFSKSRPVLIFYLDVLTASRIRKALGMQDPEGPYFDPTSKDESQKRIILFPDTIPYECKCVLSEMYDSTLEVLDSNEANGIVMKACSKPVTMIKDYKKSSSKTVVKTSKRGKRQDSFTRQTKECNKSGCSIISSDEEDNGNKKQKSR